MLRKLKGKQVYTGSEITGNLIIIIDEKGTIKDLVYDNEEIPDVEYFDGLLTPGFINTHCHLELSHLKGCVPPGNGLDEFIKDLMNMRKAGPEIIKEAIANAEAEMINNGIVAVGDISNGSDSFEQKREQHLYYHTFLEVFAFDPAKAAVAYERVLHLKKNCPGSNSITPHAPYSASEKLLHHIQENNKGEILSIHNQESPDENEFFLKGSGKAANRIKSFGISLDEWKAPGITSLRFFLPRLPPNAKIQLVHNTFTSKEDIEWAMQQHKNLYFCFCPQANLYIENRLPGIDIFMNAGCKITLGTDSLASNNELNIWWEIQTIKRAFPRIELPELLKWATVNGAEYLGIDNVYGSIQIGKTPGINFIKDDVVKKVI